jgi:hypothetical protein
MQAATETMDRGYQCEIHRNARAALWWLRRGAGIVPLRSSLAPNGNGKLSPVPLIRWQHEGPLRDRRSIIEFWQDIPEAQLAIMLENGLAAIDVDLKHLPGGIAPSGYAIPEGTGYRETTKSGGLHFVFSVKENLNPGKPTRITGLGGYVDVFTGGLLVTAPSRFTNAEQGYELLSKDIPVFPTMVRALESYAPWLPAAWNERWSAGGTTKPSTAGRSDSSCEPEDRSVNLAKVDGAIRFLQDHPSVLTLFQRGIRRADGAVDRSLTEFQLVSALKSQGFSRETTWDMVRLCTHTKSPQDARGWARFERHVWLRLP